MSYPSVLQIVPRLPPVVDGLGDYAIQIATGLQQAAGVTSQFLVGDPNWQADALDFPVTTVTARSPKALLQALPSAPPIPVLLHYVGYGYARRGCPLWLIAGLEQWKRQFPGAHLVTQFHEVYAYDVGPPWSSSFWLSPLQRHLAIRLGRLSDRCLTSRQQYAHLITQLTRGQHADIPVLPVFSNVGEPSDLKPLTERDPHLVIFGSRSSRQRVYDRGIAALTHVCQELEITQILDIGNPVELPLEGLLPVPIVPLGCLPAATISQLFQQVRAGFFDYNTAYLAKSGIFAAYAAHRLLPTGLFYSPTHWDGIELEQHYWAADRPSQPLTLALAQQIADRAHHWYQSHTQKEHVKVLDTLLNPGHQDARNTGTPLT